MFLLLLFDYAALCKAASSYMMKSENNDGLQASSWFVVEFCDFATPS